MQKQQDIDIRTSVVKI